MCFVSNIINFSVLIQFDVFPDNIRCAHCWTNDPNDSCAQGSIDSSDIVTVDKCADDDINLCYVSDA